MKRYFTESKSRRDWRCKYRYYRIQRNQRLEGWPPVDLSPHEIMALELPPTEYGIYENVRYIERDLYR